MTLLGAPGRTARNKDATRLKARIIYGAHAQQRASRAGVFHAAIGHRGLGKSPETIYVPTKLP